MRNERGDSNIASAQGMNEMTVSGASTDVNLQALAEAIVALLKQEARIENERQGR